MKPLQEKHSQQRPQKSAGVVTCALEAKRTAPVFFGDRRRNQCVTRRRAGTSTEAVQESGAEQHLPDCGKPHQWFANGREELSRERNRFSPLQFVRQCPSKPLHDVLGSLGKSFY